MRPRDFTYSPLFCPTKGSHLGGGTRQQINGLSCLRWEPQGRTNKEFTQWLVFHWLLHSRECDKSTGRICLWGFEHGQDLMTIFHQYLQGRVADYSIDQERKKLWRVLRPYATDSTVNGIVETGEYGYTADLYNVDTETVSYQRIGSDAEMMPFYFLTHLPAHRDEGIILLQRRSNLGIRTIFLRDFTDYFASCYPGFKVSFNPLVPKQLSMNICRMGDSPNQVQSGSPTSDLSDAYDAGRTVPDRQETAEWSSTREGQSIHC